MTVEIPKYDYNKGEPQDQAPCWMDLHDTYGNKVKPTIVCKCGAFGGIGLHHVHADGRVTASFYHQAITGEHESHKGCGWHVFLKLKDYHGTEFKPEK